MEIKDICRYVKKNVPLHPRLKNAHGITPTINAAMLQPERFCIAVIV
jgi:hypothetical protein